MISEAVFNSNIVTDQVLFDDEHNLVRPRNRPNAETFASLDARAETLPSDVQIALQMSRESGDGYRLVDPVTGGTYGYVYQGMVSVPLVAVLVRDYGIKPPRSVHLPDVRSEVSGVCLVEVGTPRAVEYPQFETMQYPTFSEVSDDPVAD